MNVARASIAIYEGTSPALWPPIPSQTAKRLLSLSRRMLSSFSLRRRPTSVCPTTSSMKATPLDDERQRKHTSPTGSRQAAHGLQHLADGPLQAHEDGPRNDAVPDVELADLGDV